MELTVIIVTAALWLWFLGAVVTYRLGKYLLVEGVGVKSAEGFMLALFTAGALLYLLHPRAGRWVLLAVLLLWLTVQFFCHWYYTLFGASPRKLEGYNRCFAGTLRLIPQSDTRLIPDLYHIVLHTLILLDILMLTACALRA